MNETPERDENESADAKARRLREIGDGTAVYVEVGQDDEQRDVNQPAAGEAD